MARAFSRVKRNAAVSRDFSGAYLSDSHFNDRACMCVYVCAVLCAIVTFLFVSLSLFLPFLLSLSLSLFVVTVLAE